MRFRYFFVSMEVRQHLSAAFGGTSPQGEALDRAK